MVDKLGNTLNIGDVVLTRTGKVGIIRKWRLNFAEVDYKLLANCKEWNKDTFSFYGDSLTKLSTEEAILRMLEQ